MKHKVFAASAFVFFFSAIILLTPMALACNAADASNFWWSDYSTSYNSCIGCPSPETSGYFDFGGIGITDACLVSSSDQYHYKYYSCSSVPGTSPEGDPCNYCMCIWVNDILWHYGATNACPFLSSENGAVCKTRLSGACEYPVEGKWDASQSKCIQCSSLTEDKICGDTSGIYDQYGTGICIKEGDKACESACNPAVECDDTMRNTAGAEKCSGNLDGTRCLNDCTCGCTDAATDCPVCPGNIKPKCTGGKCGCDPTCKSGTGANDNCELGYCCTGESPNGPGEPYSTSTCVRESTVKSNGKYICVASSPGNWIECSSNTLGEVKEIDGNKYVCSKENENYVWFAGLKTEQKELILPPVNLVAISVVGILFLIL